MPSSLTQQEIRIVNGEDYRATIKHGVLSYWIDWPGEPIEHYNAWERRLEVLVLYPDGAGGGGMPPPPVHREVKLPRRCEAIRFTRSRSASYDELMSKLIESFVSASTR